MIKALSLSILTQISIITEAGSINTGGHKKIKNLPQLLSWIHLLSKMALILTATFLIIPKTLQHTFGVEKLSFPPKKCFPQ